MIQQITIKGIEQSQTKTGNIKITIKDDTHKYSFYKNKKDGTLSKAYEQWKELQDNPIVVAEVKSEEQTFTNQQGKVITFMSNMIMYFDTKNAPRTIGMTQTEQMPTLGLQDDTISKIRVAFKGLQEKTQYLESENAILRDKVEKLENEFNGVYQACIFGKCEDAYEMGKLKLKQPEIPVIDEGETPVKIDEIPY